LTGSPNKKSAPGHILTARQYALKLLSYRGRSEKEISDRLKRKGFRADVIAETIGSLKQSGLVDDSALAENLKREAFSTKMLSRYGAKQYLLGRGIPPDLIEILHGFDETTEIENAKRIVRKKMKTLRNYEPEIIRRRMYNVLLRKGYAAGTIRKVLHEKYSYEEEL
jgi:regulatory protein